MIGLAPRDFHRVWRGYSFALLLAPLALPCDFLRVGRSAELATRMTGERTMKAMHAVSTVVVAGALCFSLSARPADPLPRAKPEEVGMSSERLALIAKAVNAEI